MVYVIYGSPCSGKTTWIKEHIQRGDLVCDVDYLYSAITTDEPHNAELYTHEVACQLDKTLKDIIRDRQGIWQNAYVVSIANTKEKLQADKERVNADECIFIDTPYEVCMERAEDRPFYFQFLIQEWFETRDI